MPAKGKTPARRRKPVKHARPSFEEVVPRLGARATKQEQLQRMTAAAIRLAPTSLAAHAVAVHRTNTGAPMVAARHHAEWVRVLEDRERYPWVVVVTAPGYGKALKVDTPVLTTVGWKDHGDLQAGDEVFAPDGRPVRVLASRHWGSRPCYRVVLSNRSEIVADEAHEWDVLCDRERYRTVWQRKGPDGKRNVNRYERVAECLETHELLTGHRKSPAIPVAHPLEMPAREFSIDPYLLGVWIAEGTSSTGALTIGRKDLPSLGHLGRDLHQPSYANRGAACLRVDGLTTKLRRLGVLNNKHIPTEYLLASEGQRLALLQGLMDGDGYVDPRGGQAEYGTIRAHLARQVQTLICSLGMKASITKVKAKIDGRIIGDFYRVLFHPHRPIARLARKAERCQTSTTERARRLYIKDVIRTADQPTNCITVEGGRYLAGEQLVPTHNSSWFSTVYPSWRIGQSGGQVRIGLISNEWTLASGFSKTVQDAIMSRPFQLAYPGVTPDFKRGWRLDRFFVNGAPTGNNPTLAAAGIAGPIQGRRFDEIILDDPTTQDDARSETTMEQQRMRLRGTILNRFPAGMRPPHGEGGRMVVVLTRWGQKDLVPLLTEDLGFKLIHMPALGYWDRYYECPSCHATAAPSEAICGCVEAPVLRFGTEPLWPEVEPLKQLLAERHDDELMFELVKQGNPKALSGDVFDAANFQRGRAPREFDMIAQYVDTAGGRDRRRGDYFAIVTMGRRGKDAWVLDVKRGRYAAPEQERMVIYAGIEWDPDVVAIEAKNEGVALYQRLVAMGSRLPLQLRDVTREKEFRAIPLASAYRAHLVYHASHDSDGNPNKWMGMFESELDSFPGAFDDMVDGASGAYVELDRTGPRVKTLGPGM